MRIKYNISVNFYQLIPAAIPGNPVSETSTLYVSQASWHLCLIRTVTSSMDSHSLESGKQTSPSETPDIRQLGMSSELLLSAILCCRCYGDKAHLLGRDRQREQRKVEQERKNKYNFIPDYAHFCIPARKWLLMSNRTYYHQDSLITNIINQIHTSIIDCPVLVNPLSKIPPLQDAWLKSRQLINIIWSCHQCQRHDSLSFRGYYTPPMVIECWLCGK